MDLLKSINELEELVASSRRVVFTNKCLIEEDELVRLIDDIRKEWPTALKEAEEINKNREKIIEDAELEAKNIVNQAKAYAQKKVSEDEITIAAKEKANEILEKTRQHSETIRNESIQYADQIFEHMSVYMQNIMTTIQTAKSGLKDVGVEDPTKQETPSITEK